MEKKIVCTILVQNRCYHLEIFNVKALNRKVTSFWAMTLCLTGDERHFPRKKEDRQWNRSCKEREGGAG